MNVEVPNSKIPTKVLVDELYDRVDDQLYAPEKRADDYMECLSNGQKEHLHDLLEAIRKRCG